MEFLIRDCHSTCNISCFYHCISYTITQRRNRMLIRTPLHGQGCIYLKLVFHSTSQIKYNKSVENYLYNW